MNVKNQKRLAAQLLKKGKRSITFDKSKLPEIKEAITKADIRSLITKKIIKTKPYEGHSRAHARKLIIQKRKGKRKKRGSQKGKKTARLSRKTAWIGKVRSQRNFIKKLKSKQLLSNKDFRNLYVRIKNNKFRNIRLIKLYIEENKFITKNDVQKKTQ